MTQFLNMMNKKSFLVFTVVVLGHVGALCALNQVKETPIKAVEKRTIQVHMQSVAKEKPVTPVQPKQEKAIEKPKIPTPPPKKVEKVEQVKKATEPKKQVAPPEKKVQQPPPKSKPVQESVPKQAEPLPATKVTETARPITPVQQPKHEEKVIEQPKSVQPEPKPIVSEPAPIKTLSVGEDGIEWKSQPELDYDLDELKGSNRSASVLAQVNEKGKIVDVAIVKSTGVSALDSKVKRAILSAKFKAYIQNGKPSSVKVKLSFNLTMDSAN